MKLFLYFGFLLSVFVACEQNIDDENQNFPVIVDFDENITDYQILNSKEPFTEHFEVQYIGKWKDSIKLDRDILRYSVPPPPPLPPRPSETYTKEDRRKDSLHRIEKLENWMKFIEESPLKKHLGAYPFDKNYELEVKNRKFISELDSTEKFFILVDTTQKILKKLPYQYLSENLSVGYAVLIQNQTNNKIGIGVESQVFMTKEAKDTNGEWKEVNAQLFFGCGTGIRNLYLNPSDIVMCGTLIQDGDFETEFRLRMGNFVSNTYRGRMNRSQFIGS